MSLEYDDLHLPHQDLPQHTSLTPLDSLIQAILNEKNSPEVLHYQKEVVDEFRQQIKKQEEAVEDLERDHTQEMKRMVFNLELKRIRYLLRLYLRTRLHKLEGSAAHIIISDDLETRLSPEEIKFTEEYFVLVGRHLKKALLDELPSDYQDILKTHAAMSAGNDLVALPALDTHIFCSILQDVGSVQLDEEQVVDMKQGDLFIVRYEAVASLVKDGRAVLV